MKDFAGDIDDASPLLLFHVGEGSAGEQEWAFDEKVEHFLVEGPVIFFDGFEGLGAGGVGDHDIDGSEIRFDLGDHLIDIVGVGDVSADEAGGDTGLAIEFEGVAGSRFVMAKVHRDFRAGFAEGQTDSSS